jgi:mediator of RNA polymerase II transcription subunit 25
LILLYSNEKKAYLGFIPNDQVSFVDRIRTVIQQQKTGQLRAAGMGQQQQMGMQQQQGMMPQQQGLMQPGMMQQQVKGLYPRTGRLMLMKIKSHIYFSIILAYIIHHVYVVTNRVNTLIDYTGH